MPKKTMIKYPKKMVFLLCCEPVIFHVFHAQNRVQLAWPQKMLNRRQLDYQGLYARVCF